MSKHSFFLAVTPKAAARTKATCRGKFATIYTAPAYRAWLDEAVPLLTDARPDLSDEEREADVQVTLEVIIQKPQRTVRVRPGGDNDNYEKGVWDALTKAGWWKDDSQVVKNDTIKRWAAEGETPGYRLTVRYL